MPKVHKTCTYSKKSKKWSSKVTKPAYTQKNQKNQKLIHLCQSVPHKVLNFWFFWVYAGLVIFPYQNFWFFWVYAGLVTFPYQNFWFFWVYAGLRELKFTKPAYTQKNQHFDAKSAQNLHILKKKTKKMIVKSHQTCIYSKKSKKSKLIHLCQSVPHRSAYRVWNFWFFWFFWVYAGLVTFPYQNFWFFWVYAGLVTFPYQMFDFLSICRFEGLEVHETCIYSKKINILMPKVHKTCIYSKKSKKMIVKSHQTCIYSKKSKKSRTNSSMPVSPT